jgi:hypothetical protein
MYALVCHVWISIEKCIKAEAELKMFDVLQRASVSVLGHFSNWFERPPKLQLSERAAASFIVSASTLRTDKKPPWIRHSQTSERRGKNAQRQ